MNAITRKYNPVHESIDESTNRKLPLEIVDIIASYATVDRTQLLKEMKTRHSEVMEERETDFQCRTMKTFTKQIKYYLHEMDKINKIYVKTDKNRIKRNHKALRLSYKIYDILLDMKYLYWKADTFLIVIQNKLKEFYFNKPIPYINVAHYYRLLFNDELEETQHIKDFIAFKKKQFQDPLTMYKVKHKTCSICKEPGHNKRSCEHKKDREGNWQTWKNNI